MVLIAALMLAACATQTVLDDAKRRIDAGQIEDGLRQLEQAAQADPRNAQLRTHAAAQREIIVNRLIAEAELLRGNGQLDMSETAYRRVLAIAPGNARATMGIAQIETERRNESRLELIEDALRRDQLGRADALLREVLTEQPNHRAARSLARRLTERQMATAPRIEDQLGPEFAKPIGLEFREAQLRQVFEIIARQHGVNFVFDKDVRPDLRVTIFVRNTSIDDVIKLILATNQLERKILNPTTMLIYPNTPAKAKEYVELVTRSFYLGNSDAKQTLNMIRTLVKTRDVFIDEKLNLLIMRDTPNAVRYAEKLILVQDLAEPEVMLEVEVLEVSSAKLKELGVRFPERINFGPLGASDSATPPGQFRLSSGQLTAYVANPAFVLNLKLQEGSTNVLANPRIRVRNREKARVHIGEKVPVVTTTSTANVGVSASVSYLEVGLKLDVEPNVYLEDEIAIKVGLEVSNIIETLDVLNTRAYRLGTRNALTTLRLRDGETQVLAGLIQDEDRRSANKLPGLGELPVLGRLFGTSNDQHNKNEIVLLITPRVVRNLARPDAQLAEIPSGTEASIGARPLLLKPVPAGALRLSSAATQAPKAAVTPAPEKPAPTPRTVALNVLAPQRVALGGEVGLRVNLAGQAARVQFEISYDPAVLSPIAPGATPNGAPGRLLAAIESSGDPDKASYEAKFRVIAKEARTTQLSVQAATAFDADGTPYAVNLPGAHSLSVVAP